MSSQHHAALSFALTYRRIHFLLKAKRQLSEDEICELEAKCALMGQIMPRVLGGNITPKQHELIHHVPQFARRWRTVGFFREEGMEAKHHEVNGINRVLGCMRKEEDRLANCLRRVEVRQTQKAGDLAVALPRESKNLKCDVLSLYSTNKLLRNGQNSLKTAINH